jgi:hypothetical protein
MADTAGHPELEIDRVGAVGADHLHPQARGNRSVRLTVYEVSEAAKDVVHAHDGGRGFRGVEGLTAKVQRRCEEDRVEQLAVAGRDSASNCYSPVCCSVSSV